jgi:flagellar motility protein MotE (MotC chaperone)
MKFLKWILAGCLIAILAMAEEEPKKSEEKKVEEKKGTPIALTVEAIQELERRKQELDTKERELNERAQALEIQEKLLKEKIGKMEELQTKMGERLEKFKSENEGKVSKLVTMVETMKPQSAAEYVENLDPDLAVEILSRINVTRAAKVMNLVDKKKGARLSELYTGYLEKITTNTVPAKTDNKEVPAKTKM